MQNDVSLIKRRLFVGLAGGFTVGAMARAAAGASTSDSPVDAVEDLDNALLASMKAGGRLSFDERYRALEPVIARVFDLNAVLAASIGLGWTTLPDAEKAQLAVAFRRYTVSSYASNFDSYNGQQLQVSPSARAVGDGDVVVQTQLLRTDGSSFRLDYVMRRTQAGWQAVDVLTNGAISRVAVQRSDFRGLLRAGGAPALTAGLERKTATLSGGFLG